MIHFDYAEPLITRTPRATGPRLVVRNVVAKEVIDARIKKGWSQRTLAEKSNTTPSRISEIENSKANIRLDTLDKVVRALGLKVLLVTKD